MASLAAVGSGDWLDVGGRRCDRPVLLVVGGTVVDGGTDGVLHRHGLLWRVRVDAG